ncbi:MAG: hypothetical protein BWZ10_01395 [candidate division BRC1 bacterium ADurb.BinA364]|nr:MAG: hypothetical protein BWZ10_01395 [candidate division BRC1 bacterium ADurb.BinA364]
MRRAGLARFARHLRHPQSARQSADVVHVGLHDIDGVHRDHAAPLRQVVVLLASRHGNIERGGDLGRPFQFPIRARLLEVAIAVLLEETPDLDRPLGRIAAVAVDVHRDVVADGFAHGGHERLGSSRPGVLVVAAGRAGADFERPVAVGILQPLEPFRLVLGRDVAAHARTVGRNRPRLGAEQLADQFSFALAAQVPKRRIDAGQGAADIGPGELVVGVDDAFRQSVQIGIVGLERDRRHLAMQHQGRDVGVEVGRLAPSLHAVLARDPNEGKLPVRECLDAFDFHASAFLAALRPQTPRMG